MGGLQDGREKIGFTGGFRLNRATRKGFSTVCRKRRGGLGRVSRGRKRKDISRKNERSRPRRENGERKDDKAAKHRTQYVAPCIENPDTPKVLCDYSAEDWYRALCILKSFHRARAREAKAKADESAGKKRKTERKQTRVAVTPLCRIQTSLGSVSVMENHFGGTELDCI